MSEWLITFQKAVIELNRLGYNKDELKLYIEKTYKQNIKKIKCLNCKNENLRYKIFSEISGSLETMVEIVVYADCENCRTTVKKYIYNFKYEDIDINKIETKNFYNLIENRCSDFLLETNFNSNVFYDHIYRTIIK